LPIKVPVNATCEVQEPDDEEFNEDLEDLKEEVDEELEELGGSQFHFLTIEGIYDEDEYDERVVEMNIESYSIMTQEKMKKRRK
ncbi:hypothetical protein KI387_024442, partial [Taxus chinensis]